MTTKIGNTKLVYNRFNNYYKWQLRPDHLFSDKFYVTAEGYKTFDMFDDDIYIQDLINENQVSETFMEFLNQEIDEAFHDYQKNSDLSMRDRTEIVRSAIISKLNTLNLEEIIIK